MALPSPSRFGRYVVLDLLTGEPGEITLLAFDPELDRKVGLKVFDPSFDGEGDMRRRDKARTLARIVHPHVVRVHDVGVHEGQLYVAMDFVPGRTLTAWLGEDSAPRSWQRRLDVMLAAGEGLAAAHAAGLVHGGFSGHAVIVGDDGQVRVIDFVRSAPNRHGRPPDALRDRIDFCATLHRVLWGGSPWNDDGEPRPPPVDTQVPWRIRRAVLDGMRRDDERTTLPMLLSDLRRAIARRRIVRWAALGSLGIATSLAAALLVPADPSEPVARPWCQDIAAHLDEVWNADVTRRGHAAFVATGAPYADEVWSRVQIDVDAFVTAWREAQARDCARRGADTSDDAITLCLHRQYEGLRAFVAALTDADREVVAGAAKTVAGLGSPSACESLDAEPSPWAHADGVLEIQSDIEAARVQRELGRYAQSVATAYTARARASDLGLRALVAEADFHVASGEQRLGKEDEAEQRYHAAISAAVATDHLEIVARAALELSWLLAERGRGEEAQVWKEHAAAAVERVDKPELRSRLAAVQGSIAFHAGDYATARDFYAQSGAIAATLDPPDPFAQMHADQVRAICLGRLGDVQAEIDLLQESLAFTERTLGERHPNVGHHLHSLAAALSRRGSVDLAVVQAEQAHALFREAFGTDHANTIATGLTLASIYKEAGRIDEAEAGYAEGLAAARRALPPDDPRYVTVVGNVGMFHALRGRHVEAAALLSEAATRQEALYGPDHSFTLGYLNNLAATYMFSGLNDEAAQVYRTILRRTERSLGDDHPQLVPCLLGLATVEHELGQSTSAVARLERALAIAKARGERAERTARVQMTMAQVLWDANIDRERALASARASLQGYLAAGENGWDVAEQVADTRAWLAEHE